MKTLGDGMKTVFRLAERPAGPLLLKDVVLASAAITVMARDAATHEAKLAQRPQLSSR